MYVWNMAEEVARCTVHTLHWILEHRCLVNKIPKHTIIILYIINVMVSQIIFIYV